MTLKTKYKNKAKPSDYECRANSFSPLTIHQHGQDCHPTAMGYFVCLKLISVSRLGKILSLFVVSILNFPLHLSFLLHLTRTDRL